MPGERVQRILARLSAGGSTEPTTARLCEVCAEIAQMTGAGIMLMVGNDPRGSLCSSDEVSSLIEDLQYTLGEGPCVDAFNENRPVQEPDLDHPESARWLAFTPPVVAAGARAVFGFPVHVGAVKLGALNLYRDWPGPLTDDQYCDALVLASVAARAVLAMQAGAPPGVLAAEFEQGANLRFVVHQAAGMVAVQLGSSLGEAMVRLRAYAFAKDRLIDDVAAAVVRRELRFGDRPPPDVEPEQ